MSVPAEQPGWPAGLSAPGRILLCLRYGIGDLVMELPVLDVLRRAVPGAWIAAVGARPALELLESDPRLDAVFAIQDWGLRHWGDPGSAAITSEIAAWLRDRRFDLVLDGCHAVLAFRDVLAQAGIPRFDTDGSAQDAALRRGSGGLAAVRAGIEAGWGLRVEPQLRPRIHLGEDDERFALNFFRSHGIGDLRPIAISPVASSPLKRWPVERFALLADHLLDEGYGPLLLFQGPDREAAERLLDFMRRADRVVGVETLHLGRTAALLSRCSLLVCNDTGLMHLAAAVGTPPVAVFGPTASQLYLPVESGGIAVEGHQETCRHRRTDAFGPSACIVTGCCLDGRPGCIGSVQVRDVLAAVRLVVARQPAGRSSAWDAAGS